MMDVLNQIADRSGLTSPLSEGTALDPGWGNGLGNIAPGLIAEVGGNGSGFVQRVTHPQLDGMQTGHGTVIIVGILVLALVAFHVTTRGYQV